MLTNSSSDSLDSSTQDSLVPSENETDELTKQLDNKWINTYGIASSMLKAKDESPENKWLSNEEKATAGKDAGKRNAHESEEEKCRRCGEYVVKIVHLKTKRARYKQKKQTLKQENERLKNQLDGRRETDHLRQYAVKEITELKHKNAQRDLEEKLKEQITVLNEKTYRSETVNNSLVEEIRGLMQQIKRHENAEQKFLREKHEEKTTLQAKIDRLEMENGYLNEKHTKLTESTNLMENMVRESQKEKTAMIQIVQKLQEEKDKQAQKIVELEQKHKDSMENIVRERQEEKTAMDEIIQEKSAALRQKLKDVLENIARERQEEKTAMDETIQKLQEEKQIQAQKIFDLEQKVKIADETTTENIQLQEEFEQQRAALDAVKAQIEAVTNERDTARTQLNSLQTHSAALHHLIGQFQERIQVFEARGQDDQALRNDLLEITNGLQFYPQFGPTNVDELPSGATMMILRAENSHADD